MPKTVESRSHRIANIEAPAVAGKMPIVLPPHVSRQLIDGVEASRFEQAFREAQSHRGVVRPLPRLEPEQPATYEVSDRFETPWRFKFHRGSDRISRGKSHHRPAKSIQEVRGPVLRR